jgi:hypothetical protein
MFIFSDLNAMKTRAIRERVIIHEDNFNTNLPVTTTVPDLADDPLGKECVCMRACMCDVLNLACT